MIRNDSLQWLSNLVSIITVGQSHKKLKVNWLKQNILCSIQTYDPFSSRFSLISNYLGIFFPSNLQKNEDENGKVVLK